MSFSFIFNMYNFLSVSEFHILYLIFLVLNDALSRNHFTFSKEILGYPENEQIEKMCMVCIAAQTINTINFC